MRSENTEQCRAPATSPSAKHALVIEDFPVIAMSIEDELADMGYSAAIAASEAEAVALAEERCPDLIIADLRLAEGCGIEAVRRICGNRSIAVIFMSGDLEAAGGDATGKAGFLSKPFTSAALRSSVDAAGSMSTE
jgi:CheY-like chemotaxis protein